jgi:hypothetical protein
MTIRIVSYVPSASPLVQAFIDIELDGWLRFNGLNLHRDGKLWSAQLTIPRNGGRSYRNAVEILDGDLSDLLRADILAAIHAYIETLPPERRMKPVRIPEPKVMAPSAPTPKQEQPLPPRPARPVKQMEQPVKPQSISRPKTVPPPKRLLVDKAPLLRGPRCR